MFDDLREESDNAETGDEGDEEVNDESNNQREELLRTRNDNSVNVVPLQKRTPRRPEPSDPDLPPDNAA